MHDPSRLADTESGDALRLLRAARDVPAAPSDALERTLASLGVPAVGKVAAVTSLTMAKYLVLGALIGGGAAALVATQEASGPVPPLPLRAASSPQAERVPSATAEAKPVAAEPPAASGAPATVKRASIPSPSRAPVTLGASLGEENQQLDRVRKLVTSGAAIEALTALDEYDSRFRPGQLAPEAALLRVRAYMLAGRRQAARQLAQQLLQSRPAGDYASRVREAAGLEEGR